MAQVHEGLSQPELLDIVDDEWMMDTLPDDDIPLPASVVAHTDENEDAQDVDANANQPEKWIELGLHGLH
eukprot:CAMPEP_0182861260 /NCGR_PEP_ID=MMETSP0034_2-20130328/5394_1 /TAXON_ID=156128 /ORGANISM="Nephroselmis pyriformis, Strain CCMP717" /LENGTH=69 /DNA_ID=CAMNT_0024993169 /DNA_START=39 /DNA_END=248 /DNA_ORIENTATION=+